jgi:predicted Zn-dependent peptidase
MKFTKKILKNGLRVVTIPMKENPTATVFVMVEAGSKYETKETNGISHFLEHMVFKGTPRRPKASIISRELDGLGADYNAFTGNETTGYYAKVEKKHIDTALDIISDMYLNPLFPEEEIEKEKGVIIEEIRMYKDRPEKQVADALDELMFGDQPVGWTILGPEENIRKFKREDFVKYRKQHYVPSATTIVVSGNIDEKDIVKKIEKIFKDIPSSPKKGKVKTKELQKETQVKVLYKDTGQTHVIFGIRTFGVFDKRLPILRVLSTVLGGGMSSRLFTKMRDELGICYYVGSYFNAWTDHGTFNVSAGVDTSRVELGVQTILEEIQKLATERVPEDELKKAKDYLISGLMLGLETSDEWADYAVRQETIKKEIKMPEEIIKDISKVTAADIQKIAREFFVNKNLNMAIIGPYKEPERFEKIVSFKKVV